MIEKNTRNQFKLHYRNKYKKTSNLHDRNIYKKI